MNLEEGVKHTKVKCALYKMNLVGNVTFRPNRLWQCPVEISDYNSQLGSTGEFDNILRITPGCQAAKNISWMRLGNKMIIIQYKNVRFYK